MNRSQQRKLDDMNYYNDPRTRAAQSGNWYKSFDEVGMTVKVELIHYDDNQFEMMDIVYFPVEMKVCDLCNGKGSHVNPSIDCGGLTQDDWLQDPGFEDDYITGAYDIICNKCNGKRSIPVIDNKCLTDYQKWAICRMQEQFEENEASHAERMNEIRMGY